MGDDSGNDFIAEIFCAGTYYNYSDSGRHEYREGIKSEPQYKEDYSFSFKQRKRFINYSVCYFSYAPVHNFGLNIMPVKYSN